MARMTKSSPPPADDTRDSRLFKLLRRWLAGRTGMRSKHGANLALDILAENGVTEIAVTRGSGPAVHVLTRDKVIASAVVREGSFGREIMDALATRLHGAGLQPSSLAFVNVGANIGLTCLNAHAAGFRKLYAIEPEPENFRLLSLNMRDLAGEVHTINAAVGAAKGRAQLHRHETNLGAHSLVAGAVSAARAAGSVEVAVEPLAALYSGSEPFVLFIDVEGFEPQVIAGAGEAIARNCAAIVLEVTPSRYEPQDARALAATLATFADRFTVLPSNATRPACDLAALICDRHQKQVDIALLRRGL
ncbi:MAG: FkbM family methyltransferase [Nitratireductor sp.]|nr:FkbM family methyltransferase [Nitratireductor sp.]